MTTHDMTTKLKFFKDASKKVHIKVTGRFYNGIILYLDLKRDLLVLMDSKLGEVPILFEEIERVEPFIEKEVKLK